MFQSKRLVRRDVLRWASLAGGTVALGGLLQACAPTATPAPAAVTAASPTLAPAPSAAAAPSALPSPSSVSLASPVAQTAPAQGGALLPVRAAWITRVVQQLVYAVALEAGYFQKYGVAFDLSYIQGSNTGIAGIASNNLDMIIGSGAAVVSAQSGGEDVLVALSSQNKALFDVVAAANIATLDDLKGKTVAVTKVGSSTDYFYLLATLDNLGWQPTDLQFVSAGDQAGQVALFQQGQVQAIFTGVPEDLPAMDLGGHSVFSTSTIDLADVESAIIVGRDFFTLHRDAMMGVAKACVEAVHRWKTDPNFTQAVIQKYLQSDDPRYTTDGWQAFSDVFIEQPLVDRNAMLSVIDQVALSNPTAKSVDVDKTFDNSVVQELIDNGFIAQVYGT